MNFGQRARAEEFLAKKLAKYPDDVIKSFEVPESYLLKLRAEAVPERLAKVMYPDKPYFVDVTKAPDQFGLRADQVDELVEVIIPGSGRIG